MMCPNGLWLAGKRGPCDRRGLGHRPGVRGTVRDDGAPVVACDVDAHRGEATVADLREAGHDAVFKAADVTDDHAVAALVAFAVDTYGRLDCAANCAGVGGGDALTTNIPTTAGTGSCPSTCGERGWR